MGRRSSYEDWLSSHEQLERVFDAGGDSPVIRIFKISRLHVDCIVHTGLGKENAAALPAVVIQ